MKKISSKNKTIFITDELIEKYVPKCISLENRIRNISKITNRTIIGNSFDVLKNIPSSSVNLIVTDPPYNIGKKFNQETFKVTILFAILHILPSNCCKF